MTRAIRAHTIHCRRFGVEKRAKRIRELESGLSHGEQYAHTNHDPPDALSQPLEELPDMPLALLSLGEFVQDPLAPLTRP